MPQWDLQSVTFSKPSFLRAPYLGAEGKLPKKTNLTGVKNFEDRSAPTDWTDVQQMMKR